MGICDLRTRTATILTLLVVPIFYTFFDDARVTFARVTKRALLPKAVKSPDNPVATDTASS